MWDKELSNEDMKTDLYLEEIATLFIAMFLTELHEGLTDTEHEDMQALFDDLTDRGVDIEHLVTTGDIIFTDTDLSQIGTHLLN